MAIPISLRSQILDVVKARLEATTEFKLVNKDAIRLSSSEFEQFELPAVQIIAGLQTGQHQRQCLEASFFITIEIVLGPTTDATPTQNLLLDYMTFVSRVIFDQPNLGIPGVIGCTYVDEEPDLHFVKPYYVGRVNFEVKYMMPLVAQL